jgi:predicted RNA-binding Zn ribbon-like protein
MDELADRLPPLAGGAPCLDFVNTVDPGLARDTDRDHLGGTYAGLLEWAAHAGLLTGDEALALRRLGGRRAADAARAYDEAVRLREAIFAVFRALATGGQPGAAEVAEIRERYADAVRAAALVPGADATGWEWRWDAAGDLRRPHHVLAASAIDLLTAGRPDRVRACAGEACGWLFLDRSRNGSRRWCLMRYCGNALKSTRQAAARRAERRAGREGKSVSAARSRPARRHAGST